MTRFKQFIEEAATNLIREKYIMRDILARRKSREYTQKIFRFVKDTNITSIKNQLNFIYININLELRRDIKISKANITINAFLNALDKYKYF